MAGQVGRLAVSAHPPTSVLHQAGGVFVHGNDLSLGTVDPLSMILALKLSLCVKGTRTHTRMHTHICAYPFTHTHTLTDFYLSPTSHTQTQSCKDTLAHKSLLGRTGQEYKYGCAVFGVLF